jgi:hypothetical protein
MSKPWTSADEDRGWHAAVSKDRCDDIEATLQSQGLDVVLVDRELTGDDILKVACIFDGPDSDPEADRFTSYQETD